MWNKAGGEVIRGLVNRREAEIKLFLTPVSADMHTVTTPEGAKTQSTLSILFNAVLALFKGKTK